MFELYRIGCNIPIDTFPPIEMALEDPDGLLAVGGDLSVPRLLAGYRRGIFPWYNEGDPILWWSPSERMVLFPEQLKISRSLRKNLRHRDFSFRTDSAFKEVMLGCAAPRGEECGTWINPEMLAAYCELNRRGLAHSFECWQAGQLVGGLYGVVLGKVFFGESMFHHVRDASKATLAAAVTQLHRWGFELIDCQLHTAHLASLGACPLTRDDYRRLLDVLCPTQGYTGEWVLDADVLEGNWI